MNSVSVLTQSEVLFAEECDRGAVSGENQDSVLHARLELGDLLIVADGRGGGSGGATASRMVVKSFHAYLEALPGYYAADKAIREAAARANASILVAANAPGSPYKNMGSTVVMALVQQEADKMHAWIGHIGDSRAYLARAGHLYRLTTDHSAVQALLDRNMITPEDTWNHPQAGVLSRSVGQQAAVEIEIDQCDLGVGDTLLLCSDGLWGCVPERELQRVVADMNLPLETTARYLLDMALDAGGEDNIGIEMARLPMPVAAIAPTRQPTERGLGFIILIFLLSAGGAWGLIYFLIQVFFMPQFQNLTR